MLTDCLAECSSNESCSALNYETGLCVLLSSSSDRLPGKVQDIFQFECETGFFRRRLCLSLLLLRLRLMEKPTCWNVSCILMFFCQAVNFFFCYESEINIIGLSNKMMIATFASVGKVDDRRKNCYVCTLPISLDLFNLPLTCTKSTSHPMML